MIILRFGTIGVVADIFFVVIINFRNKIFINSQTYA